MAVLANETSKTSFNGVLMKKRIKVGLIALGLCLFSSFSWATPCSLYWNGIDPGRDIVPQGFGASFDVFVPVTPLITVDCSSLPNVVLTVGTENSATQAIYNTVYLSKDGTTWNPVALTSTNNVIPNNYFQASASGVLNLTSGDLANWNYIAFLVAYYRNGSWIYGCATTACSSSGWNLQAITQAAFGPDILGIVLSSGSFYIPASSGSNIATISAQETFGSSTPTLALDTTGACAGSPSADNGSFAVSGTQLNVGGSTITGTGPYHICLSATDASAANSPVYQAFTLNVAGMASITSINLSSLNFTAPAPADTAVSNVSASLNSGLFGGTLALDTASTCAGAPSADNAKFSFVSPTLKIAQGPSLGAGVYSVCFSATNSIYANSPYYQAFHITGLTPPMLPVPTSISPTTTNIADTAGVGDTITPITVATSDGSAFGGTLSLTSNPGNLFALSGSAPNNILTVGASGPGSDGNHIVTAQATQNVTSINQNITISVMPVTGIRCDIGPNYPGSIPAPALAAGFTHCAANWDFSQATYATQANWLDCPLNTNPSLIWHEGSPGVSSITCNMFQVTDPSTSDTVLRIELQPGDYPGSHVVGMQTKRNNDTGNPSFGATNYYVENTYRLGTTCTSPNNGCGPNGAWTWNAGTSGGHIELDFMEVYGDSGGFANGDGFGWQSYNPNNLPGGFSVFNYNQVAALITSNGFSSKVGCSYVDQRLQADCVQVNPSNDTYTTPFWLIATAEARGASAPNGNIDLYIKSIRVFTCPGLNPCNGSTQFSGSQDGRALTYWH
jgi:hypothetical protein